MFNVKCHCVLIIISLILNIKAKHQKTKQNKRLEKKLGKVGRRGKEKKRKRLKHKTENIAN